jgi:hypothetical protein
MQGHLSELMAGVHMNAIEPVSSSLGDFFGSLGETLKSVVVPTSEFAKQIHEATEIYEQTKSPLQKHADALFRLHDLEDKGLITPRIFATRKSQLDEELENQTKVDNLVPEHAHDRGGFGTRKISTDHFKIRS